MMWQNDHFPKKKEWKTSLAVAYLYCEIDYAHVLYRNI